MKIAGITTMVMLFIALGVAWGLSESSRLRIVGSPAQVTVIVMFFDLRGSTQWARSAINGDYHYAGLFIDQLRTWVWRKASEAIPARPNLVKFLGDGFMFVWETPQNTKVIDSSTGAVAELGCVLAREYPFWARSNTALWKEVPKSIGIGIDAGSAIRLTFENGSKDYMGEPVNNAAKMQDAARPLGGVVIRREVWKKFDQDDQFQQKFPGSGEVRLGGNEAISVHATGEIEFSEHYRGAVILEASRMKSS